MTRSQRADALVAQALNMVKEHPGLAVAVLHRALDADPNSKPALQILGVIQHQRGQDKEAKVYFEKLIKLDPDVAENYANLGTALSALGEYEEAQKVIEKAVQMEPNQLLFKNNLAFMYKISKRYEEALEIMEELVKKEDNPQFWDNLGSLYADLERYEEAERCCERSVKLNSKYIPAQMNLHLIYHFRGDWKRGCQQYEWRYFYKPDLQLYLEAYDLRKMWDGKADLNGKRVLVYGEQGFGDIIMYSRFCNDIKNRGAHVILHCPKELNTLLKEVTGIDEVVNVDLMKSEKLPQHDYQFALMSAPYLLGLNEIKGEPYIHDVDTEFREFLKEQTSGTFNVGIVWAGGKAMPDDAERSIPLQHFKALTEVPNVRLFSLQMGENAADKIDGLELVDLTGFIKDFGDTARVLASLDLLICCDTAIAHVAGAMGFPVWDLIRYGPDWRWPDRKEQTCWYDSMRQFHQTKNGDWSEVFDRVADELKKISRATGSA